MEKDPCGRHSPDFERPNMSELRIVLLGRSGEEKSKVGNIILGRGAFETEPSFFSVKQQCDRARGQVDERHVTVINTPDLLHPQISQDEVEKQMKLCVHLSDPGPHVLLLVLQPERFTEKDRDRMRWILDTLSDQAFKYTMVLVTHEGYKTDCIDKQNDPTELFIEECRGRHHRFNNIDKTTPIDHTQIIEKLNMVVKENEGTYLTCEIYEEVESGTTSTPEDSQTGSEQDMGRENKTQALSGEEQKTQEERILISRDVNTEKDPCGRHSPDVDRPNMAGGNRLNLVLFGGRGAGKTSAGNAILGQRESSVNPSSSSVWERREGEVCDRLVTVVEMPALCKAQLSASSVSHHCASLCVPGVHAFLLVIPAGPLTDEDKGQITRIQELFGSRVTDYMMVLFTHESLTAQPVLDFLQQNKDTQELLKKCDNRFCVLNTRDIVSSPIGPQLLKAVEEMNKATESCFTLDMYCEAQLERKDRELEARYKNELEEKDRKIRELEENIKGISLGIEGKDQSSDCVRIVLVGKTGSGKSATGNTILQREEFLSQTHSKSVTTCCKKGVWELAGRRVAVVDTPGLFNTSLSNEEVQQEIAKCISYLAPGPHVFLLVLQIGRITKEEKDILQLIQSTFGKMAEMFTIVMFTRGDDLNESIESFIQTGDAAIQNLIKDCGGRFHVFSNKEKSNRTQVSDLLDKIDMMVRKNGGGCYTNEMFQEAEMTLKKEYERILREKEGEMQREREMLEEKHEEEMKEMSMRMEGQRLKEEEERTLREKELKEKEEHLRKELEKWKKREQEEKNRTAEEEKMKEREELMWKRKVDEIEKEKRRIKEEWKRKEKEEKKNVEREEMERQELIEKQRREKEKFEEKQAEEKKKRDREEQERKNCEERERQEWKQKIKEAEKEKKEVQEEMKKTAEEWKREREMERIRKEEEEVKMKQKEVQERRDWDEKQKKMRDEFEKEREQERLKTEKERREKEKMERELEERKGQLEKQKEEWDKERKEERDRSSKEDEQRRDGERKRLASLQEEFEREREEEIQKRKKEYLARREREEKACKEMEEDYERKIKGMRRKYEEDARNQAEEFNYFREKYKRECLALSEDHNIQLIKLKEEHQRQCAVQAERHEHSEKSLNEKIEELKVKHKSLCVIL